MVPHSVTVVLYSLDLVFRCKEIIKHGKVSRATCNGAEETQPQFIVHAVLSIQPRILVFYREERGATKILIRETILAPLNVLRFFAKK
jgi:hypothetical protein